MTTATLAPSLRTELLGKALAWVEANPGCHLEAEVELRSVDPYGDKPTVDRLSIGAIICTVAGLELNWGVAILADMDEWWPSDVTHIATQAYDASAMRWDPIVTVARHVLDMDGDEAGDLFELTDPADVVAHIRKLIQGEN